MTRQGKVLAVIALLVAVAAITPHTTPFLLLLITRMLILAILAMSVDLLLGYTGLPSLGQAAYLGLGACGRGLMTNPDCLIMDEPSEGLAPIIIQGVWEAIGKLRQEGLSILLVEQNAALAIPLVDYVHVLEKGRVSIPPARRNCGPMMKSNRAISASEL